ncbi:MAG: hypothetical protein E7Z93_03545 [Cyanobacteria bacterium SIG32]|nr:hypothetical protein [Cyanobacteria bacterium SIG32]
MKLENDIEDILVTILSPIGYLIILCVELVIGWAQYLLMPLTLLFYLSKIMYDDFIKPRIKYEKEKNI